MCYCQPEVRTPFCLKCAWKMSEDIQVLKKELEVAKAAQKPAQEGTPSSKWKQAGVSDPHGNTYNCERSQLCMGNLTDDELANAAFLNYDCRPPLQDIVDGKAFSPIAYMTAVKDRIRWLSRKLEEKIEASSATPEKEPFCWYVDETGNTTMVKRVAELYAEKGLTVIPLYK